MIVRKTSIFPASRNEVFTRLQRLDTLQYIAAPFATFIPVLSSSDFRWQPGSFSSFIFKLFGIFPFGVHQIFIERFDADVVQSRESNQHVPVWNHKIILRDLGNRTEYTDEVEIKAGWKTPFIWIWANAFYAHRQRKWIKLLKGDN